MKGFKKLTAVILCAVMVFTAIPMSAFAADERTVVDSGFCGAEGENLTWTLYDDGELVISGEGEMKNYRKSSDVPWFLYYGQIKAITLEEGVTSIGYRAFLNNRKSGENEEFSIYCLLNLPKSIETIPENTIKTYAKCQTLIISYAGSEEDWSKVKYVTYGYDIEYVDESWFDEAEKEVVLGHNFSKENETECVKMLFNGEKPDAFCEVYCKQYMYDADPGDEVEVFAHYYPYGVEGEKIIWYMILDGEESVIGERELRKDNGATVTVPERGMGELYVRAELVDESGNTVASSENYYIENNTIDKRTFKEKLEDFLRDANFTVFFTTFFIVAPIVFGPIVTPIALLVDAIRSMFEK